MRALDRSFARAQFPAYDAGNPLGELAFFEAAGGSFPARATVDRLTAFYTETKVQPGHPYGPAREGAARMASAVERLAAWLGVAVDELLVGPSTTQNAVVLAAGFREILGPGDAVVLTDQAHEANAGPWDRLVDAGVDVRTWRVDPSTGTLDLAGLGTVLDGDVAVVAFPQVSNLLGDPIDVAAVCEEVHAVGALAVVDGVAAAPHGLPWVDDLGADAYLFSSYKTYGPHQGVMVVREAMREQLPNQGHWFNADLPRKRLVPAGPDHAQVAALAGMVDYFEALDAHHADGAAVDGRARTRRVETLLRDAETVTLTALLDAVAAMPGVARVLGPTDPAHRVPTVALELARPAGPVAASLGEEGVACAVGHFYSKRLTDAMDVDPAHVLRFSFTHTTTHDEVDRAIAGLRTALAA